MTHDNQQQQQQQQQVTNPPSRQLRVAIVGAGFAGLTLANYLQKHKIAYELLESKSEPIPIIGTIRLPHATNVLQELGILLPPPPPPPPVAVAVAGQEDCTPNEAVSSASFWRDDMFSREVFLNLLRANVKVQYSSRILRVVEQRRGEKGYSYLLSVASNKNIEQPNDELLRLGPFDLVVAADGLFGNDYLRNAVIGDARWQHDTWLWDFGRRRIQRGADIAICDGMELGKQIVLFLRRVPVLTDNKDGIDELVEKSKFASSGAPRRRIPTNLVLLPIVLAILYRIISQLEKI